MLKRKIIPLIIIFLSILLTIYLFIIFYKQDKKDVIFIKCLDGDSIILKIDDMEKEIRLLAIDCPELNDEYGLEAKQYCEELLKKAQNIRVEKDIASQEIDRYNRYLMWVFVDDELLQAKLIAKGYAKVRYIYGQYLYLDDLYDIQDIAMKNKIGIFSK